MYNLKQYHSSIFTTLLYVILNTDVAKYIQGNGQNNYYNSKRSQEYLIKSKNLDLTKILKMYIHNAGLIESLSRFEWI